MDLNEFTCCFHDIRKLGYIQTRRKGNTGVGYTFETLLDIKENNRGSPDIEGHEIKTHRDDSTAMITLFTFNNKVWQIKTSEAALKYGVYNEKEERINLYHTLSLTPNSAGLFLEVLTDKMLFRHIDGDIIAIWPMGSIVESFVTKFPSLLFVSAHPEERNDTEYFKYYRCQLMSGASQEILPELFRTGIMKVDIRLHLKSGATAVRNHGSGFRILEKKIPLLFTNIKEI